MVARRSLPVPSVRGGKKGHFLGDPPRTDLSSELRQAAAYETRRDCLDRAGLILPLSPPSCRSLQSNLTWEDCPSLTYRGRCYWSFSSIRITLLLKREGKYRDARRPVSSQRRSPRARVALLHHPRHIPPAVLRPAPLRSSPGLNIAGPRETRPPSA